jgi:hypothetical protein
VSDKFTRLKQVKVEYVPIDSLLPNPWNPNVQDAATFEMLVQSILDDGFDTPILVRADNVIIDGEHRWRAAQDPRIGMTEIPIVRMDVSQTQHIISMQRHNNARGTDDLEATRLFFEEMDELGVLWKAAEACGYNEMQLAKIMGSTSDMFDHLANTTPSEAWEPVPTLPGDVAPFEAGPTQQSVSSRADAEAPTGLKAKVPGLGRFDEDIHQAQLQAQPMHRLVYMFTNEQAEVVDQVLGPKEVAASNLVKLCAELEPEYAKELGLA